MPTTRKRHQQQQRAQQLSQQQSQQQQQQSQLDHYDKQNNNSRETTNGSCCPSQQNPQAQQPSTKAPLTRAKATKDNTRLSGDQNEKSAVHKDIQALLESDLYCAICREVYIDPLILNCAHSFCKFCLNHWLSKQVGCPTCRMVVVFQTENLALKDIVNKMIKTSSPEFQSERAQSLDQRVKAEQQQKARGVKPMMERKSFNLYGKSRKIPCNRSNFIRSWRGPNGATIWQTRLDDQGQVVRPEREDDTSSTDGDYDEEEDVDSDPQALIEIFGDGSYADDAASTIDIDSSDESYLSSRRRRLNDLNILAGLAPADDDEDFEIESISSAHSDTDESMQGIESDSDESESDVFNLFAVGRRLRGNNADGSSTEEEGEDEDDDDDVEYAIDEDEEREAAFASDSSQDYTSDSSSDESVASGTSYISEHSENAFEDDDDL